MSGGASAPIGLLGGSFDPVHAGHLQLARDAQRALGLAQVVFIPAGQPWQKSGTSPAGARLRMLELALAAEPGWLIDRREIERPGPTYTVDTARALRAESGPDRPLVWIMGSDQLGRLDSWHRWEELPALVHIAYAERAGTPPTLDPLVQGFAQRHAGSGAELARRPAGLLVPFAMRAVDCSASAIRAALRAGDAAYAARYLPDAVLEYLRHNPLYAPPHGNEKTATPGR
jgi:nicotinate-nucleotide adenylyltransferase